jgi:hypothetical protein
METKVISLIKEINHNLTSSKRTDGTSYTHLKDGRPQWMRDAILAAHGGRLPNDQVYRMIDRIVSTLSECKNDGEIEESLISIEPDIYTSDLTEWLNDRNDNVYYLTQALEESDTKDGFQLLSYAQAIFIREIADGLIHALNEIVDKQEVS